MRRLIVYVSKYENSLDGAKKIKNEADFDVEIFEIERFCQDNNYNLIKEDDVIFFLCASDLIYQVTVKLENKGCRIINIEYFLKHLSKKEIQIFLEKNKINIPKLYTENINENRQFPIFLKENMHTGITVQLYNDSTQNRIFEKFNYKDFYLEEPVKIKNANEIKVYCVNGEIFYKNNQEQINEDINNICKRVIEIFNNIEVCSIDFIYNDDEFYLIDFNPSSGFYSTDKGRKGFIKYCNKIINK